MYPGPEYFMEKMLERWKFIQYLPGSQGKPGTFVKNRIEPKIVIDNGFPDLYKNINTDFNKPHPPGEGRLIPFPRHFKRPMQFFLGVHPVSIRQALAGRIGAG